jgi:hypothetical protein
MECDAIRCRGTSDIRIGINAVLLWRFAWEAFPIVRDPHPNFFRDLNLVYTPMYLGGAALGFVLVVIGAIRPVFKVLRR